MRLNRLLRVIPFALALSSLGTGGALGALGALGANEGILTTKHNLSKSGPGPIKTDSEVRVCIFCHTPHHASTVTPLWSRPSVGTVYDIYSSSTRFAKPGQPTGSSRLCLSCHDGTIAVGALLNNVTIPMVGGYSTIPIERPSNLGGSSGKDLTNDHPISFKFGSDLLAKNKQLVLPTDARLKLDRDHNMQCTTCHNAHNDPYGKFLVMSNAGSGLCVNCHNVTGWQGSVHKSHLTIADKGCVNCHVPHNARTPQRLMKEHPEEMNCLPCHSSGGRAANIETPLSLTYKHDVRETAGVHDTAESSLSFQKHVECEDCHNPHAVQTYLAVAPAVNGALNGVKGVALGGELKETAAYQYEICFKCHADKNFSSTVIQRQVPTLNLRLKFALENASYHPVEGPGKNGQVQSLRNDIGLTPASVIYCTDCHGSDRSVKAGGNGSNGPHGSTYQYVLLAEYDTETYPRSYSDANYALCFRCHFQERLFAATSPFSIPSSGVSLHDVHVVQRGVPCFICHDPHGSKTNQHLINFATNFNIVASYDGAGFPRNCTSNCHLTNPTRSYGPTSDPSGRFVPKTKRPALRPF